MGKVYTTTCKSFLKHQNVFWLEDVSAWIKSSFLGEGDTTCEYNLQRTRRGAATRVPLTSLRGANLSSY